MLIVIMIVAILLLLLLIIKFKVHAFVALIIVEFTYRTRCSDSGRKNPANLARWIWEYTGSSCLISRFGRNDWSTS